MKKKTLPNIFYSIHTEKKNKINAIIREVKSWDYELKRYHEYEVLLNSAKMLRKTINDEFITKLNNIQK